MSVKVDPVKYEEFCHLACMKYGLDEESARATAKVLIDADLRGIHTHGTISLYPYMKKTQEGGIDLAASPETVSDTGACAVIDGHNAMPTTVGVYSLYTAMERASKYGVSYVATRNSGHYGACSAYALMAAEKGYFAIVLSNTIKNMGAPGGKGAVIGNSPICFACPAPGRRPVCLDIATSTVSGAKAFLTLQSGRECQSGWIMNQDGEPITKPKEGEKAVLSPMGDHKGFGISFFIEILSAVLSGGGIFGVNDWMNLPVPANVSHGIILIDVSKMAEPEAFAQRMKYIIEDINSTPARDGTKGVHVPGDGGWAHYDDSMLNGLELNDETERRVREMAEANGLDFEACVVKI